MTTRKVHSLILLTPLMRSGSAKLLRIRRTHNIDNVSDINFVATGDLSGIIVCDLATSFEALKGSYNTSFNVWIRGSDKLIIQEARSFQFLFRNGISTSDKHADIANRFILELLTNLPKDYVGFMRKILKLVRDSYTQIESLDVEFKMTDCTTEIKRRLESESDGELEDVTAEHVREVLEHAYPESLSVGAIAESLRCPIELVESYLERLEKNHIATPFETQKNEWIRVNTVSVHFNERGQKLPTIAIITCLFVEKQCIDAVIEDAQTLHKHSKTGDSGVYTLGMIGGHRVVATKLAMIGDSRDAVISTGNTTTRLLGSFQNVEHVILLSTGGGIPHITNPEKHIRLGDVVISHSESASDGKDEGSNDSTKQMYSPYVYAHNFVLNRKTQKFEGFTIRKWIPKDNALSNVFNQCSRDKIMGDWRLYSHGLIEKLNVQFKDGDYNFSRPPDSLDQLRLPIGGGNYVFVAHPNADRKLPSFFLGPIGSMITVKRETKPPIPLPSTTPSKLAKRDSVPQSPSSTLTNGSIIDGHFNKSLDNGDEPTRRGSTTTNSNDTMNDSSDSMLSDDLNLRLRENFINENRLKAYDSGFDAVISSIEGNGIRSWIMIQGISDYYHGSSKLARSWQPYAAANAAAMVKVMLDHLTPSL